MVKDAIKLASEKCTISEKYLSTIMQSRQTLLFYDKQPWVKKSGTENFDVPMGCYDGAEVCELVGLLYLKPTKHCHEKETCWIIPGRWSWL